MQAACTSIDASPRKDGHPDTPPRSLWTRISGRTSDGGSQLSLYVTGSVHVTLDASTNGFYGGLPGLGAYNHSTHQYFSTAPTPEYRDLCIADLELITHVVAVNLWGSEWKGVEVTIHTDNQACWHLLRNGRSRDDRRLRMSRGVATNQITNQWRLVSEWIPTTENSLADALSRVADSNQREKFQDHCDRLGGIPRQRHVNPEMFKFR